MEWPSLPWGGVRRELLKYGAIAFLVCVPVAIVFGVRASSARAQTAKLTLVSGYRQIQQGFANVGRNDRVAATASFTAASQEFAAAKNELSHVAGWGTPVAKIVPGIAHTFRSAEAAVAAGTDLAQAGTVIAAGVSAETANPPIVTSAQGVIRGSFGTMTPLFRDGRALREALTHVTDALRAFDTIDPRDVPSSAQDAFRLWQGFAQTQGDAADRLQKMGTFLAALFAADQPKEYLMVLQNNDELRPTGGFMGTVMLLKFDHGTFTVVDAPATGPYDITAHMAHTTLPPEPLYSVSPFWTFQDSNWFIDAPTSASFILDFYRQARGFVPDGVIFVTPTVIEDLLKLTGPLTVPGYDLQINADNFLRTTENQVENNYNKLANNPKQFIVDLFPVMLNAVTTLPPGDAFKAAATVLSRIDQHDIMFTSRDSSTQAVIDGLGWSGRLPETTHDSLAVVDTNLGGGKTDRVIDESVHVTLSYDGTNILHQVAITRTHHGQSGDPFSGTTNRDFIRIYTPPNAQLAGITGATIPAEDFYLPAEPGAKRSGLLTNTEKQVLIDPATGARISHENDRTVFGAWSVLPVGATQTITFSYTTPFVATNGGTPWTMSWTKQPGATLRKWQVTFQATKGVSLNVAPTGIPMKTDHDSVTWTTDSTVPRAFSAIVRKK